MSFWQQTKGIATDQDAVFGPKQLILPKPWIHGRVTLQALSIGISKTPQLFFFLRLHVDAKSTK